jgi:hypothetical protein
MLQLSIQSAGPHKRTLSPHLRPESVFRQDDLHLPILRFQLFELLWPRVQLLPRLWRLERGVEGWFVCRCELQEQYIRRYRAGRLSVRSGCGPRFLGNGNRFTFAQYHWHQLSHEGQFQQTPVVADPPNGSRMRFHLHGYFDVLEAASQKAESQQDEAIRHCEEVGQP